LNFTYDKYGNLSMWMITAELITRWVLLNIHNTDNFSVVLGGRIDNHNRLGFCYAKITCAIQSLGERSFAIFSRKRETKRCFCRKSTALASSRTFDF
jgi:hypothetical protein